MANATTHDFFVAFLQGLGLPVTQSNLNALASVAAIEGANDRFNPLNVVQPEPGSSSFNSVGVQRYADFASGVAGSVALFKGSHWGAVRSALAQGNNTGAVLQAFKGAYTWDPNVNFPNDSNTQSQVLGRAVGNGPATGGGGTVTQDSGAGSSAAGGGSSAPDASTYLAAESQMSGLFSTVPELQDKLNQAIAGGWTADQFVQAVQTTDWYRGHAQSVRSALALQTSDPATWAQNVSNKRYDLEHIAGQIGVTTMTPAQADALAAEALTYGLDDTTLQRLIAYQYYDPSSPKSGQAAQNYQQLEQMNSDYTAGWSEQQINDSVRQLISGQTTMDTYKQQAITAAKVKYPGLTDELNAGLTVSDVASPYKSAMGQILEVDPQAVTNSDPLISKALQNVGGTAVKIPYSTPGAAQSSDGSNAQPDSLGRNVGIETATGTETRAQAAANQLGSNALQTAKAAQNVQSPTPLWAFQQQLRQDPRWAYTDNAKQATSSWLLQVGKDWGFAS